MDATEQSVVRRFFSEFATTWDSLYGGKRNAFWRTFDAMFRRDSYERYDLTFRQLGADLNCRAILNIASGPGAYCLEAVRPAAPGAAGPDARDTMSAHTPAR